MGHRSLVVQMTNLLLPGETTIPLSSSQSTWLLVSCWALAITASSWCPETTAEVSSTYMVVLQSGMSPWLRMTGSLDEPAVTGKFEFSATFPFAPEVSTARFNCLGESFPH